MIHTSGLHGVEGVAGSAIQRSWLEEATEAVPDDAALVMFHTLNPFGMAWVRRFNENNVDLNRNVLREADGYAGAPRRYEKIDPLLNPPTPPADDGFLRKLAWLVVRYGLRDVKHALAAGQYVNPLGICFGGHQLEEGPQRVLDFLQRHLAMARRIIVIDVHTGLGRFGQDRFFLDEALTEAEVLRN